LAKANFNYGRFFLAAGNFPFSILHFQFIIGYAAVFAKAKLLRKIEVLMCRNMEVSEQGWECLQLFLMLKWLK
jgi:hypothetical protein